MSAESVTITMNVDNCWSCPYATNSSKEHDCAFTSEPYPCRWWCTHKLGPKIIKDQWKVHEDCPFRSNNV